ncbi:hypothetical protein BDP27DRAFT_315447 [Rhodocollybia butyracea]|uniref:RING-type domain-containing protein n=1 Tax=Rhodocollybia butyracea TaxID=206335 RepID=A0A9P5Q335_9AGAR|nr:hypothetical protein BDP27DRAFT_315447 [Rhodocollybia butyracea]
MIAHMSYSGSSPLTRRRYGTLQTQAGSSDFEDPSKHSVKHGNESGNRNEVYDDTRRNCVVCTTQAREIICWPCRRVFPFPFDLYSSLTTLCTLMKSCLSMCDFCRESLAARSSASKHKCPCCRRGVEGYSRIYIP